jgi:hypothetical protein
MSGWRSKQQLYQTGGLGKEMDRLGIVVSNLSGKNKDAAKVGHPLIFLGVRDFETTEPRLRLSRK